MQQHAPSSWTLQCGAPATTLDVEAMDENGGSETDRILVATPWV
jgi:hypothetical protein